MGAGVATSWVGGGPSSSSSESEGGLVRASTSSRRVAADIQGLWGVGSRCRSSILGVAFEERRVMI